MLYDPEKGQTARCGLPESFYRGTAYGLAQVGREKSLAYLSAFPWWEGLSRGYFTLILRLIRDRFLILSSRDRNSMLGRARGYEYFWPVSLS